MNTFTLLPRHKILVSPLLVGLCLSLCLTACGRPAAQVSDDGAVVLTVWETYNNEEHDVYVGLAREFEPLAEKEFGVKVRLNIQRVPFDGLLSKLKTAALTHTTPDICRVDIGDMPTLAYGKALLALDQTEGFGNVDLETYRKDFVAAAIGSNIVTIGKETHLYGLPDQTTCVALYWNKKLFRQSAAKLSAAGLNPLAAPKTWDEFIRYGKILTDTDRQQYGFAMDVSLWWTFPFFNTYGASFITRTDTGWVYTLNEKPGVDALQLKADLYNTHKIEAGAWLAGAIGADQGFMSEKYAMILSGPWRLETFRQSGIDYGVSLVPEGPAGTSTNVGGTDMVVFRKTKHPKIALAYLKFLSANDFQIKWSKALNQVPVRLEAISIVSPQAHPDLRVFMEQMKSARPRPGVPNYNLLEQYVTAEMELALKGIKTPQKALDDAGELVEKRILSQLNILAP